MVLVHWLRRLNEQFLSRRLRFTWVRHLQWGGFRRFRLSIRGILPLPCSPPHVEAVSCRFPSPPLRTGGQERSGQPGKTAATGTRSAPATLRGKSKRRREVPSFSPVAAEICEKRVLLSGPTGVQLTPTNAATTVNQPV